MGGLNLVDTRFDVRNDASGKDPDSHSKTLRRYHQLLWSKPLPGGDILDLDTKLHHKSELGEFWLSSDSITPTYSAWGRPARLVGVVGQVSPTEMKTFYDLACTVGAYVVFPLAVQVLRPLRGLPRIRRSLLPERSRGHRLRISEVPQGLRRFRWRRAAGSKRC